jgi:hypothetical protein
MGVPFAPFLSSDFSGSALDFFFSSSSFFRAAAVSFLDDIPGICWRVSVAL